MTDNPYALPNPERNSARENGGFKFTLLKVLIGIAIAAVVVVIFLPVQRGGARTAARRTQCKNNLKQIGLALENYHEKYGSFPPAYSVDANGNPLHSWRTLILPHMDQEDLYKKIDLSKQWDDPANAEARKVNLLSYRCPAATTKGGETTYLVIVGSKTAFPHERAKKRSEISDGTAVTLFVIETPATHAVHWMSPQDLTEQQFLDLNSDPKLAHTGGMHCLLGDGSVRFLSENLPRETRHSLITANGGESLGEF